MEGIYGLHQRDIGQDHLQFVGLEVADKMPLHIGRHLRHFGRQFLGTALRKDALAGRIRLHQTLHRMEFGNCHQRNFRGEFLSDYLQILFNHKKRCPDKAGHNY